MARWQILHAYTNQYALRRRMQAGGDHPSDYQVDRAIVWFSDISDFSRHALNLAPDRTADIVQQFFNAQSVPIAAHGGHTQVVRQLIEAGASVEVAHSSNR